MFATLLAAYPRPAPQRSREALVRQVLVDQLDAGLDLLSDGQVGWTDPVSEVAAGLDGFEIGEPARYLDTPATYRRPRSVGEPRWHRPITLDAWRLAASLSAALAVERGAPEVPVKATLVGPYTLARLSRVGRRGRAWLASALAEALNLEVRALVEAGAPIVQLDESALVTIPAEATREWRLVAEVLRRATDGLERAHVSLAIAAGSAPRAAARAMYDAPFSSYYFDLIAGPDNWYLVAEAPPERGIVVGVGDARSASPDDEPVLIWAARYAASMHGRGLDRVGLAPSFGLELRPREEALAKIRAIARASRKAAIVDPTELGRVIDPRATDARSAALGSYVPPAERPVPARRSDDPTEAGAR